MNARARSSGITAVLLGVLAMALLTAMDGIAKHLSQRYGILQITFLRFAFSAALAGVLLAALRPVLPSRDSWKINFLRAVFITIAGGCFFYGISRLPLADAFAISYLTPILVALLSMLLLGEWPTRMVFAALGVGFLGALVTVGGLGAGESPSRG